MVAGGLTVSPKDPNAIDLLVGQNIRFFRMSKGMSQTRLGSLLGISFQQVQKYERGVNRVSAGRLVRMAKILAIPVRSLLHGADGAQISLATAKLPLPIMIDRLSFRLAEAFSTIQDDDLRLLLVRLVEKAKETSRVRGRGARK
jgi:transcriptional regulator with XRE-family HTH domain